MRDEPAREVERMDGAVAERVLPMRLMSSPRTLRWVLPISIMLGSAIVLLVVRSGCGTQAAKPGEPQVVTTKVEPVLPSAHPAPAAVSTRSTRSAASAPTPVAVATPLAATPTAAVVATRPSATPPTAAAQAAAPATAATPVRMKLSLKDAQVALTRLGYDPGPVDNVYGRLTRSALARFQRTTHLPASGTLDDETWRALTTQLDSAPQPGDR